MIESVLATIKPSTKEYIVLEDEAGKIFSLTPNQFADIRVRVIPRCFGNPIVIFEPEVLLVN